MTMLWETDAPMVRDINRRIAAEISWARTRDRVARTRPAREMFLKRFEKEVDPDGTLPVEERRQRAEHAKRAYMLQLAKRSAAAGKARYHTPKSLTSGPLRRSRSCPPLLYTVKGTKCVTSPRCNNQCG
jgi:hypothetical protein